VPGVTHRKTGLLVIPIRGQVTGKQQKEGRQGKWRKKNVSDHQAGGGERGLARKERRGRKRMDSRLPGKRKEILEQAKLYDRGNSEKQPDRKMT